VINNDLNAIVVDNDDDVFQIDLAEFLAARREMANVAIDTQQDRVLALANN
jgi:hypothetical protein